jgi:hypothetical protein
LQDPPNFTQIWIFGWKIPIPSGNDGLGNTEANLKVYQGLFFTRILNLGRMTQFESIPSLVASRDVVQPKFMFRVNRPVREQEANKFCHNPGGVVQWSSSPP